MILGKFLACTLFVAWPLFGMLWTASGQATHVEATSPPAESPPATESATAGSAVTVRAQAEPQQVTIGDRLRYSIEVEAPSGTELTLPVLAERIGAFDIVDFGSLPPRHIEGRVVTGYWYTLTTFDTGRYVLPAPKVRVRRGERTEEVQGNEVTIEVQSVLPKEQGATDIRDIKPLVRPPADLRPLYLGAASLVTLVALGLGFWFLLNRPKRRYTVPPPPPDEVALRALDRLWARRDLQEGRWEPYYVELSAIVRRYLEERFDIRAPEMTTEEFLVAAGNDPRLTPSQRQLLAAFLHQADLVKFARAVPNLSDAEAAYRSARRFVDETKATRADMEAARHAA